MLRDYSEAKFNELLDLIREVEQEEFSPVTDFLGDLISGIKSLFGILKLDDETEDVRAYHKEVLDQHDTDEKALLKLFEEVMRQDGFASSYINSAFHVLTRMNTAFETMAGLIDPTAGQFSAGNVKSALAAPLEDVKKFKSSFDKEYSELQRKRNWGLIEEGVKGFIPDLLGFAGDTLGFVFDFATGNVPGVVSSLKDVCDSFYKMAGDITTTLGVPIIWGISALMGSRADVREDEVMEGDFRDLVENEGTIDILEQSGLLSDDAMSTAREIDLFVEFVGVYNDLEGAIDMPTKADELLKTNKYLKELKDIKDATGTAKNVTQFAFDAAEGEPYKGAARLYKPLKPVKGVIEFKEHWDEEKKRYVASLIQENTDQGKGTVMYVSAGG